ncbi:ATP-binding protein [Pantanalinema rosaneae CENA516]|uniref:ATP-binding protein n=1 Tax=Pantanalinema rosaneae TaxID=1620701 RepID=UPI003D6E92BF
MAKRSPRPFSPSGHPNRSSKNSRQSSPRSLPSLLEQAIDAIALLDDRGGIIDANPAICQLLETPRQQLVGRCISEFTITQDTAPLLEPFLQARQPAIGRLTLCSTTDTCLDVEYTLTPQVLPSAHLLVLRHISQHQRATEDELRRQRQRVELFSEVTLKIRQSLQLKEILHTTVTEVQRILHADRVLIYQVFPDGTGKAISEAVLPDHQPILEMSFPEEVFPFDYQQLYAQGRVRAIADVHEPTAGLANCLVEFVDQFNIKAKLIVPILQNLNSQPPSDLNAQHQLWGLLIAHQCNSPRHWIDFELELMQQLADQISIALAQAQLLERLEELVEVRTAELQEVNRNLQQEINDRMQAEAALRQSEEQLRLITNALPVLIAYVDDQQNYRFNNQAYADWLGQAPEAIWGRHLQQVWATDCYQRMRPYVEATLAGQVVTYENEIVLYDGSVRSVNVTYIPHQDEQQVVKGFFALTSDISDRKAIERMKDEFISVVSHELRTPLTSLHSALKILATGRLGALTPGGQQMLGIADDSTERLVRLVNNVLDLQRIESGNVVMDRQVCNAANLMIRATEVMQAMADQHGVTLMTQPLDLSIWADSDYILQTLINLLSNAIKFSAPGGTVWLTVESITHTVITSRYQVSSVQPVSSAKLNLPYPPPIALFQVRDQGQGIPADQLERIFERFQQVDSSDSRKKGGTGLGLTICRKIIEQHDGKIWAESGLGQGSTFSFTLPALPE